MRAAGRLREAQRRPGGRGRGRGTEPGETRWRRGGGRNSASFPPALPAGSEQAPRLRPRPPPRPPLSPGHSLASRRPAGPAAVALSPPRRAARHVLGLAAPFPLRMGQSLVEVTARRFPGPSRPGPPPQAVGPPASCGCCIPPFTRLPCTSALSLCPAAPSPLSVPLAWYLPFPASRPWSTSRAPSSRRSILRPTGAPGSEAPGPAAPVPSRPRWAPHGAEGGPPDRAASAGSGRKPQRRPGGGLCKVVVGQLPCLTLVDDN